jgi:hypothetical protein
VSTPQFARSDLSKLVRPDDFRRSLAKMIAEPRDAFERHAKFTQAYEDSFIEAGYSKESIEHEVARTVLAAFNFALFEKVY